MMTSISWICPPPSQKLKAVFVAFAMATLASNFASAAQVKWELKKGTPEKLEKSNFSDEVLDFNGSSWIEISTTPYSGSNYVPSTDIQMDVINDGKINIRNADLIDLVYPFTNFSTERNLNFTNRGVISLENASIQKENASLNRQFFVNKGNIDAKFDDSSNGVLYHALFTTESSFVNQNAIQVVSDSKGWNDALFTFRGSSLTSSELPATFSIVNSGNISVSGNYSQVFRVESSQGTIVGDIENTGWIDKKGFSRLVSISSGVTARIKTFRLSAGKSTFSAVEGLNKKYGSYVVSDDTRFIFSATADLKSGDIMKLISSRNDYSGLFELVSSDQLQGTIEQKQFIMDDPVWTVTLQGAEGPKEGMNLEFSYEAKEDAGETMAVYLNRLSRDRGFRFSEMFEPLKVQQQKNVFVRPYFSRSDVRLIDNAEIDTNGLLLGFTTRVTSEFEQGVHFAVEHASFDAFSGRQNAASNALALGWHMLWYPASSLYMRGAITGAYSDIDLIYQSLTEKAEDSFADLSLFADLRLGREFKTQNAGTWIPELGLAWAYGRTDDFNLNFKTTQHLREFESNTQSDLYAMAKVKWTKVYESKDKTKVRPELGIGVRTLLTDRAIESVSNIADESYKAEIKDDRCQGTLNVNIFVGDDDWTFAMHYTGAYGNNTTNHIGSLTLGYHW